MRARFFSAAMVLALAIGVLSAKRTIATDQLPVHFRRPVAGVLLDDGYTLAIANERSGSISWLDLRRDPPRVSETPFGKRLTGLADIQSRMVVATDAESGELLVAARTSTALPIVQRVALAPDIASIAVLADGRLLSVAAPWRHAIFVLAFDEKAGRATLKRQLKLPFAPKLQLPLPGGTRLLVADTFGGQLAVIDADSGVMIRTLDLHGHNIGGLALAPSKDEIWLTHQTLNETLPTSRENIVRGLLVDNVLRSISISALLNPIANWQRSSRTIRLGSIGAGAGDPAGLAAIDAQEQLIAFAGVDEAAVTTPNGSKLRLPVGRRPTAIITIETGRRYAVLNTLDDSVTFVTHGDDWQTETISLGPQPELSSADRGERLFFDARLSADHWLSCHSCHPNGHTNGLRADTRGDQSYGAPKRVLTLRGTALTDKWAWNGDIQDLDVQVKKSLATTIHSDRFTGQDVADITTFLHKLPHPPPLEPASTTRVDQEQLARGESLFQSLNCVQCHIPPRTYTSHGVVDVGLADELGQSKFNPPSLRGVSQNARFFHDNRADSLEAVFKDHGHQLPRELRADELADLIRFLKSL